MLNRLAAHLHQLSTAIGPRPSGSPGNLLAAAYIERVFASCGWRVERQPFAVPAWEARRSELDIGDMRSEVVANVYSPSCEAEAGLVALGSLEEAEATHLAGRIAVLYGDLTRAPLPAKDWPYKDERDARLVNLLEKKRPAALLTVQNRPGCLERLVEDWRFSIPSATVTAEVGLRLLRAPGARVRLRLDTQTAPGETANIIGRKAGRRPERVLLCAHYDTKVDTPGAGDNGGGVAVLLALAERLGALDLDCGLELVAFTNEEYLPLGDDAYLRASGGGLDSLITALNFDGVGPALGTNTLTALAGSPAFEARVHALRQGYPGVVWVAPWPESNHSTFAWRGVPSLAFSNTAATVHAHLRSDTVERMSPAKLAETLGLAEAIVVGLQSAPLAWARATASEAQPQPA
jgi:aminopeptidase YwaD